MDDEIYKNEWKLWKFFSKLFYFLIKIVKIDNHIFLFYLYSKNEE